MHDTTIAAKLPRQLESFPGRISPHFHKPVVRFIGDMIYGIMVEKDVKLASIVRALKEGISPKKVEDTISHVRRSYNLEDIFSLGAKWKPRRRPLFIGVRRFSCPKKWGTSNSSIMTDFSIIFTVIDE